uniref:Uncharacterized protein n=1 Tax=Tetraodon nigroviridis TaxID=99883 RepID=H3CUT7_TETNG
VNIVLRRISPKPRKDSEPQTRPKRRSANIWSPRGSTALQRWRGRKERTRRRGELLPSKKGVTPESKKAKRVPSRQGKKRKQVTASSSQNKKIKGGTGPQAEVQESRPGQKQHQKEPHHAERPGSGVLRGAAQ